ncbi:tetratricopeptide repeat protein [Streptomyces sp. NPDC006739]|uniref:tetratricopeptide repeat protein n=1 Tax=Streptomyces sp. NPDC006739 TaxID=3364763 RepID=UPI00368CA4F8
MRLGGRWVLVAALSVAAFAGVFLLFYAAHVPLLPRSDDNRVAVGVAAATVAATVGGTWGAWWAPRAERTVPEPTPGAVRLELPHATVTVSGSPPEEPPRLLVRMGDLPREPVGFQPREDLLAQLTGAAEQPGLTVVHAVTGARGVGKTQLAAAYARRRIAEGWPVVAWITAESRGQLTSGLAELADQLGVREAGDDTAAAAQAALTWIGRNPDPCLLVLDNATDPDEVARWLPTAGRAQVLVTTTAQAFENLAGARVDVTVFTPEEALDFLRRRTGLDSDDPGARAVTDELGRLPLALAQAAHVIRARGTGYRAYLERLRGYPLETVLEKVPGERYPHRVAEAVLLAAEQVEGRDPSGVVRALLEALSVLSPAGVPRELLYGVAKESGYEDRAVVEAGLGALVRASLATDAGADAVAAHRLVQRVMRERAGQEVRTVVATVARHLEEVLIPVTEAWEQRESGGQLVDQTEALWNVARGDLVSYGEEEQQALVRLRRWAAYGHLSRVGATARASEWAAETRRLCEDALGEEAAAFRLALELEGDMCDWLYRTEQAIGARRRLLEVTERCLGPEDRTCLLARADLARSYQTAGRYELSVPMYEDLERDVRRWFETDYVLVQNAVHDLAHAYAAAGRLREAAGTVDRMRADWAQGGARPSFAGLDSLENLCDAYGAMGQEGESAALLRRYVTECEAAHGSDAPETIWARNNLAMHCMDATLYTEGLAAAERALADAERVFGPDSEDTMDVRDTLATCLQWNNRNDEAVALFRRVVDERIARHGAEHPKVLNARAALVWSLDKSERFAEAYEAQVELIADHERLLGPDVPATFAVRRFHIHLCSRHGRSQEAIAYAREVLADHERVHGPFHPHTFDVRAALADALADADHHTEAVDLLRRSLQDAERALGPGHPETFSARARLAGVLLAGGEPHEARALREKNVTDYIRVYGEEHISVVWARSDLADALTWAEEHEEALGLHRGVVDSLARLRGADHPATVRARRWLAAACARAGRHAERLTLTAQALQDTEALFGAGSPVALGAGLEHAGALAAAGRRREARRLFRALYERTRHVRGADHPYTIYRLDDAADSYREVQRRLKALRIRHRVLRAHLARSGPLDGGSLGARRRLGTAYASVGLVWRNAAVQKRLLDELTTRFGPDHPDVLWQRDWWCHALRCSGRWRKALAVARDRVTDCERRYGPDHLWTLAARCLVAVTARRTGRVRTARTEFEHLVDDRTRLHGPDHPLTLAARADLAYATLWSLHPRRAAVLADALLHDEARVFGADSVQVKRLARRQVLFCLAIGRWRLLRSARRVRS